LNEKISYILKKYCSIIVGKKKVSVPLAEKKRYCEMIKKGASRTASEFYRKSFSLFKKLVSPQSVLRTSAPMIIGGIDIIMLPAAAKNESNFSL